MEEKTAIFVHGAGGGAWEWSKWLPLFHSQGWKCRAFDLLPSPSGLSETTFEDYVNQVAEWTSPCGGKEVVLVGASMGGLICLKVAESRHLKAIILVNSAVPSGAGEMDKREWPTVMGWSNGTFEESQQAMLDCDRQTIQLAFESWRDESGNVLNQVTKGVSVAPPTCPVLVMVGGQDQDIRPELGKEMAKQFKGDLKIYPEMGHLGPLLGTNAENCALDALIWLLGMDR